MFAAGVDPKSIEHPTALSTSASTPAGSDSQDLSTAGVQDNNSTVTNGGLNSSSTVDGMTTTGAITNVSSGGYTDTITNPDGTKRADTYTDGLLTQEQTLGTTGAVIATINNVYNGLRQLSSTSDYTGTTTYTYLQDGTEQSVTLPGHNAQTVTAINQQTEDPTSTTRADGNIAAGTENPLGQQDTQSGAGQLPARFGYDVGGTGSLTSLKTFQSNTLDGTGAATTGWNYDQATGQLYQKTWADGSQDVYKYNTAGQLKGLVMPGITGSSFNYNNAGELTSSSLTDATTGTVSTSINTLDDLGRALSTTTADNGSSNTTTNTFTALGDPNTETFSSAGNTSVGHGYYPAAGFPTAGASDALASLTLNLPNAQTPVQTGYAYDPSSKRLQTITINGVNITIGYLPNSDQIQSLTAGNVVTQLTPDATDGARLGSLSVTNTSTHQTLCSGSYGYNELDQRTSDTISRVNVANDGSTSSEYAGYTYTYDPSHADALTSVKDSHGNVLYGYTPDGVGNLTGTALGSVNLLNQYSADVYNSRGDVTDNGTYTFSWDASDRPIAVTPKSVVVGSLQVKLGYDSQDRWLWKDVYQWNGSAWAYDYSRHAVWDGSNLLAELDQNNTLVKGYTWGPTGLLAVTDYTNPAQPKTYLTVADASGNIAALVDPLAGTVVASYHYDPYGKLLSATGPQAALSSFLGKGLFVYSELPGLMWAGHRVTDGKIWLSRDPSGESSDLNLYRLYGGDPINNVDPSGYRFETLKLFWEAAKTAAGELSAVATAPTLADGVAIGIANNIDVYKPLAASAGTAIKQTAIDAVMHKSDFETGEALGVVNGAARVGTGTLQLLGTLRTAGNTLLPEVTDELTGAPNQDESVYSMLAAHDTGSIALQLPDQLRQATFDKTVNSLTLLGMNEGAVRHGAVVGEVGLNVGLVAASVADPLLGLSEVGAVADAGTLLRLPGPIADIEAPTLIEQQAQDLLVAAEDAVGTAKSIAEPEAEGGVYLLRNAENGQVMRTGRTGNLVRREAEHFRDPSLKDYEFEPIHRTDVYSEQRGLEQELDWVHNPPLNFKRPIDPTSDNLLKYLRAANDYLDLKQGIP